MTRLAALVAFLLALACTRSSERVSRSELTVFAASSLTEAFRDLKREFERQHPDVDLRLNFAGSQILRLQIEQGAAADVFASANPDHMRALQDAGAVVATRAFAENELVVIVPTENSEGVSSFADLARAQRIVIGTRNVPVGNYTQEVLQRAEQQLGRDFVSAVRAHVVSEESNVRLVRAKVALGEADAAIVYRTDAAPSGAVRVVEIPRALNVRASYPIGVVSRSSRAALAQQFVDFVVSDVGQATLARHGFSSPAS